MPAVPVDQQIENAFLLIEALLTPWHDNAHELMNATSQVWELLYDNKENFPTWLVAGMEARFELKQLKLELSQIKAAASPDPAKLNSLFSKTSTLLGRLRREPKAVEYVRETIMARVATVKEATVVAERRLRSGDIFERRERPKLQEKLKSLSKHEAELNRLLALL